MAKSMISMKSCALVAMVLLSSVAVADGEPPALLSLVVPGTAVVGNPTTEISVSFGDVKTIVLPGGANMEMRWSGSGSFMMGSPREEQGRFEDEMLHPVTLPEMAWYDNSKRAPVLRNAIYGFRLACSEKS